MADSQQLLSFASMYPAPTAPWVTLPCGVNALVRQRYINHAGFSLPAFDEHLLFVHLKHKMRVWLRIDNEYEFDSRSGDTTIIPRGHSTHWQLTGMADVLVLTIPSTALSRPLLQAADGDKADCELLLRMGFADPLIYGIGRSIVENAQCADRPDNLYLDSLLLTLTAHLVHSHAVIPAPAVYPQGGLPPEILRRVTDYIDRKLADELSLTEVAEQAQYSPYHFARCFRNSTGQPLHKYVLARRLMRARGMLEATTLGIADIAQQTGFTDHSHFTSHFRRAYRLTPAQFRRQLATDDSQYH